MKWQKHLSQVVWFYTESVGHFVTDIDKDLKLDVLRGAYDDLLKVYFAPGISL